MHNTVLVPVDIAHLDAAEATIRIALGNLSENGRVILLNVIEDIPKWAEAQLPKGTIKKSRQHANEELKSLAAKFGAHMEVEIRNGHTYQVVLDVAKDVGAELIVIASHRPGFRDYYLGSTAAKVVRHADCSVYVLR